MTVNMSFSSRTPARCLPRPLSQNQMGMMTNQLIIGILAALMFFLGQALMPLYAADRPDSFADLAEKLSPAVVNISNTMEVRGGGQPSVPKFPEGSPFEEFFKQFEDNDSTRRAQSLGSGFIVDASGIVVTNNHVIENADEIKVGLANGEIFTATLLGRDKKTDIAVLKIDPGESQLTAVSFGDSDQLRVGDWVMAIGNPFGLGGTVTAGIVSARGRDIGSGPYDDFIQTDASINQGNSGGPLFNLQGEVIGINTAIFSQTGGSVGIGFAISSNLAMQVANQLQNFGRTRRGWLGVFIQEVTEDIADRLGLEEPMGALVASIDKDGPAGDAGIQPGDVIITFDGQTVNKSRDLPRIVAETDVEKTVLVDIIRNGKQKQINVTIGELESGESPPQPVQVDQESQDSQLIKQIDSIGIYVAQLNDELVERYGLDTEERLVVVVRVEPDSPAAASNISEGDIIRRLNQVGVKSVKQLVEEIDFAKDSGRKGVLMLIEKNGNQRFISVDFVDN